MSEFWVSNSVGNVSEDGSQISPFRSLASLHSAVGGDLTGHTIRLKAGDVFDEDVDTVDRSLEAISGLLKIGSRHWQIASDRS